MIDVKALREICNDQIIEYIVWIRSKYDAADAMTKKRRNILAIEDIQLHDEIKLSILFQTEKKRSQCQTIRSRIKFYRTKYCENINDRINSIIS